nr:MAG TPA: hypothetical protein [Microviridae sp.]
MLITVVTSNWEQRYEFFLYFQIFFLEIVGRGPFLINNSCNF